MQATLWRLRWSRSLTTFCNLRTLARWSHWLDWTFHRPSTWLVIKFCSNDSKVILWYLKCSYDGLNHTCLTDRSWFKWIIFEGSCQCLISNLTGFSPWATPFHELRCAKWRSNRKQQDQLPQVCWRHLAIRSPYCATHWMSQPPSRIYHRPQTVDLGQWLASKPRQVGILFLRNTPETSMTGSSFISGSCRLLHRFVREAKDARNHLRQYIELRCSC